MDTQKFDRLAEEINRLSTELEARIDEFIQAARGEVYFDARQVMLPFPHLSREEETQRYRFYLSSMPLQNNNFVLGFQSRQLKTDWEKQERQRATADKIRNERIETAKIIERDRINSKISSLRSNLQALQETYRQYASWPVPFDLSQIQGAIKEYEDEIKVLESHLAGV